MNRYLLDNRRPEAGERFAALAELFDPWTFRHLDDLGLGEGWRCWEVGAGGVSVPRGLAERVGGWLVIEDGDPALQPLACPDERGPDEALANRLRTRIRTLMAERGADLAYGRTLPRLLRDSDLTHVGAEAYFPIASRACAVLEAATVQHVRDQLLAAELATPEEIETHLANLAHGDLDLMLAPMITAWGRKPA